MSDCLVTTDYSLVPVLVSPEHDPDVRLVELLLPHPHKLQLGVWRPEVVASNVISLHDLTAAYHDSNARASSASTNSLLPSLGVQLARL